MKENSNNKNSEEVCPLSPDANDGPSCPLSGDKEFWHRKAVEAIVRGMGISPDAITCLSSLKKGITNRSFFFAARGRKYLLRLPGEGTDKLIDRHAEAETYATIHPHGLCDKLIWLDSATGTKISEFEETARTCNPLNYSDVCRCMAFLRAFHRMELHVSHQFDLFAQIDFYESLWNGTPSMYGDYAETKSAVFALRPFVLAHRRPDVLAHLDSIHDNFLFVRREEREEILLIDWEYASMQDPDVDLAMFAIYALYDGPQIDALIDAYYPEGCGAAIRAKIYAYVAICGLLWSNWCEFKRLHGVEFGGYALRQYRYAREFAAKVGIIIHAQAKQE